MKAAKHGMDAPGAKDKCKVLDLFHESVPREFVRVEQIERLVDPSQYERFMSSTFETWFADSTVGVEDCEIGFYVPAAPSQLGRMRQHGFNSNDFEELPGIGMGVPVATHACLAHERGHGPINRQDESCDDMLCLCVLLCSPMVMHRDDGCRGRGRVSSNASARNSRTGTWHEHCVTSPGQLLLTYVVWYKHLPGGHLEDSRVSSDKIRRQEVARKQREYAKIRDPLITVALQGLDRVAIGTTGTVLLPSTSLEAESVVSLYLLGGGASRLQRPPGVDTREALGGVVVQRIENHPLYTKYLSSKGLHPGERGTVGAPLRFREDVVWHGTRLKRVDGEGTSLAAKLQSIAELGFDPQRCMKGAAAEGGIWVATSPLGSFGHGCDGLVAFIMCLAKTHFNEWVDATSARVLQRERVLPLYALVHA